MLTISSSRPTLRRLFCGLTLRLPQHKQLRFGSLCRALASGEAMNKLRELDIILGEALEHANDSARVIRECSEIDTNENLYHIGYAVNSLWEVREKIYSVCPELKQDFVSEFENNEKRFSELGELHSLANEAEESNNFEEAINLYRQLLKQSIYGYYTRLAEAGLYRVGAKS